MKPKIRVNASDKKWWRTARLAVRAAQRWPELQQVVTVADDGDVFTVEGSCRGLYAVPPKGHVGIVMMAYSKMYEQRMELSRWMSEELVDDKMALDIVLGDIERAVQELEKIGPPRPFWPFAERAIVA